MFLSTACHIKNRFSLFLRINLTTFSEVLACFLEQWQLSKRFNNPNVFILMSELQYEENCQYSFLQPA